ncbi:hypothetical protein [Ekhidna sp.]|uniref:hypothetical protein n=1 Tax=Ekhidna sp. TaxID=2608089 RepID=UPI003B59272C
MERSKSLTTRAFAIYKITLVVILFLFVGFYAITHIQKGGWFGYLIGFGYPFLVMAYWYPSFLRRIKSMKELSYDSENLYVKEKNYEIQIPYHLVKDVEIVSLDGLYKFKLFQHDQFGDEIVCKPSIWYPLNYKRIDAELNRIRSYVRKAHRVYKEQIGSDRSLPSN